jgi:hypothetical protein
MSTTQLARRGGTALFASLALLLVGRMAGQANAYTPGCGQIPIIYGTPPWGFRTNPGNVEAGSFARGHGEINLETNTVSGVICQEDHARHEPMRAITMTVARHLIYHSHYAVMWGYPGNIMKVAVRVQASNDPSCAVGTVGHATLFASYNGVRSDSVQFSFPATCSDQDHLYHGAQVNNQVPPL